VATRNRPPDYAGREEDHPVRPRPGAGRSRLIPEELVLETELSICRRLVIPDSLLSVVPVAGVTFPGRKGPQVRVTSGKTSLIMGGGPGILCEKAIEKAV
jgi:hypothetical protein